LFRKERLPFKETLSGVSDVVQLSALSRVKRDFLPHTERQGDIQNFVKNPLFCKEKGNLDDLVPTHTPIYFIKFK
jgi:hypothetical protein